MRRVLALALGVLTAIGGFVDIGDIVANAEAGARFGIGLSWVLRLQASDPGWIDMAANVPVMSTARAREELGWTPRYNSLEAMQAVLDGLSEGDGVEASPTLRPRQG